MRLLGLECSGKTASAAIGGKTTLLAESFLNCGLTHSQTLLKVVDRLLEQTGIDIAELNGIAVSTGPGSFTGVRIGVALAKGLAMGAGISCYGVSSLEAMAWNTACFADEASPPVICSAMDARRSQLYNALFEWRNGTLTRMTEDRAISIEDLSNEINRLGRRVLLLGDGAELSWPSLSQKSEVLLMPEPWRFGSGWGVISAASGVHPVSAGELAPTYLRLSQAEREYKEISQKESGMIK